MLETFTLEAFEPHGGTTFLVHGATDEPLALTLTHVSKARGSNALAEREPFSLLFQGPSGVYLPQQIYRFEHEMLGTFEMFIVPVGQTESGFQYEAVFS